MKDKRNIVIVVQIGIIIVLIFFCVLKFNENEDNSVISELTTIKEEISSDNKFYVDIKGEIKKPGVYLVDDTLVVNDVIKLAGGLTSKASTKNINLSQGVKKEMVIYVFSKNDLKKTTTPILNDVKCTTNVIEVIENKEVIPTTSTSFSSETEKKLVNINTASKEELMSLPSIGEFKADSIIIYRMENKFTKIEDIKNVSGIGESYFAKIKDLITV